MSLEKVMNHREIVNHMAVQPPSILARFVPTNYEP
jgi:hypothetical protein